MMRIVKWLILFGVAGTFAGFFLIGRVPVRDIKAYGATFAPNHAENLGLDPREVYRAMLDNLGIRKIRITAYWNRIERERGIVDFSELDWQVQDAEAHNAELILALGYRAPRWPECHIPEWAKKLPTDEFRSELIRHIERVIERYRDSKAIKIWQVENEPFLDFGICPPFSVELLDAEIARVRELDAPASPGGLGGRPIMITDSGELSLWIQAHKRADVFGSTLYRTIGHPTLGVFTYPLPPAFFRAKRAIAELANGPKPAVIIELQAEPWQEKALFQTEPSEHYKTMNPEKFRALLSYIRGTGFDEFYFWGVEWWYWLKEKHQMPDMWNIARETIQKTK
ncbi:MAG: beta-galactosidase [Candidatus Niyogibacteria bacterium]|nr:beta-galactosidase [Candidatus Niyogibacteria bacterium]